MDFVDTQWFVEEALGSLSARGIDVRVLPRSPAADAHEALVVELGWNGRSEVFGVEAKSGLRPSTAGGLLHGLAQDHRLLVSDRVAGELATMARDMGVAYLDATGNAWVPARSFLLDVEGRPAAGSTANRWGDTPAGFTRTELRVVLALLVAPDLLGLSTREVGGTLGVSHGTVHKALLKLDGLGHLADGGLRRVPDLVERWTHSYLARGGAHRSSRQLYVDPGLDLDAALQDEPGVQLGGEAAAERLGWPIRAASALVYAPTVAQVARLTRASSRGPGLPLEVRTPWLAPSDNDAPLAASLLVRADMLASRDSRQIEVAQEAIRHDQNLRRLGKASH